MELEILPARSGNSRKSVPALNVAQQREQNLEQLQIKLRALAQSPPASEAVKLAQQIGITQVDVITLGLAFVLGGFTSPIWTWRMSLVGGRNPTIFEIVSSALVSAVVAFMFGCGLIYYEIPLMLTLVVSVMCGFSGDSLVRLAIFLFNKIVINTVEKIFGVKINQPDSNVPKKDS
jgi:hypothetical protein